MEITAQLVKELRDKTGTGMMDCKKALVATDGDIEKAIDWLREKGIAKAANKASRIAAEGICMVRTLGNRAIIFEVNCETDFVAKNEKFVAIVDTIGNALVESDAMCEECALATPVAGKPLSEYILEQIAAIGEKVSFRRFEAILKKDDQQFGEYVHLGGKIATLSILNNANFETAKDVAMHVAASNPKYLSQEDISEEVRAHEMEILTKEALNENAESAKPKPEDIIKKMVIGRLNKNFKEICLLSQPFIKNPDETVEQYVKSKGSTVALFRRLAVGEGVEKKEDNFVEEVMKQANQ